MAATDAEKYPQAAKLDGLRAEARTAGEFYDWLMGHPDLYLMRFTDEGIPVPACVTGQELVAEFLGIDYPAYQREKDAMLEEIQARQTEGTDA